jgi:rubredoxin
MDSEMWMCPVCGGLVFSIGPLGSLEHGRCQNCGLIQSRAYVEEVDDQ